MSDITTVHLREPEDGDVVALPENVGRTDAYHDRKPARGTNFEVVVVGTGDRADHVLLSTDVEDPEVEDGAYVLASDVERGEVWYAVPRSAYGGN